MSNVTVLRLREQVLQDNAAIAANYQNIDPSMSEQMVIRALGELALVMAGIAAQIAAHDLADLNRHLNRLQRMAENLGLVSLASVAGDTRACLATTDSTAFSAVWARLIRVAEVSLVAPIGCADRSG